MRNRFTKGNITRVTFKMENDESLTCGLSRERQPNTTSSPAVVSIASVVEDAVRAPLATHEERTETLLSRSLSGTYASPILSHVASPAAVAASAEASDNDQQPQQHQQDLGGVEHRRAMELLISLDEEAEGSGKVIVCPAPDRDNNEDSRDPNCSAEATVGVSDLKSPQSYGQRSTSHLEGATEMAQTTGAHAYGREERAALTAGGDADTAATMGFEALAAHDSYIAQLTAKALEQEREDVLKVHSKKSFYAPKFPSAAREACGVCKENQLK